MADPGEVAPHVEAAFSLYAPGHNASLSDPPSQKDAEAAISVIISGNPGDDRAMIIAGSDEANGRQECKRDTEHARPIIGAITRCARYRRVESGEIDSSANAACNR